MSYNYATTFPARPICEDCREHLRLAAQQRVIDEEIPEAYGIAINDFLNIVILRVRSEEPDRIWTFAELGLVEVC